MCRTQRARTPVATRALRLPGRRPDACTARLRENRDSYCIEFRAQRALRKISTVFVGRGVCVQRAARFRKNRLFVGCRAQRALLRKNRRSLCVARTHRALLTHSGYHTKRLAGYIRTPARAET